MIVTCERCATQFQLDDARIPAGGVRVRCSRCKHAFKIDLPEPGGRAEPPGEEEESDWQFNADLPGGDGDTGVDGIGREAATSVVDELLGPSSSSDSSPEEMFAHSSSLEIGEPESAAPDAADAATIDLAPPGAAHAVGEPAPGDVPDLSDAGEPSGLDLDPEPDHPRRRATDELASPESWDLLADADGESDDRAGEALDFGATSQVPKTFEVDPNELIDDRPAWQTWVGHAGAASAWLVVGGLFLLGLHAGLKPAPVSAPPPIAVGDGLQVTDLSGRWVDHLGQGPIYVATGRLYNDADQPVTAPWLGLEPVDAAGRPLAEPAPIGSPRRPEELRELPLELLARGDAVASGLRPGEKRQFEAVIGPLPPGTRELRVVLVEVPAAAVAEVEASAPGPGPGPGAAELDASSAAPPASAAAPSRPVPASPPAAPSS